MEKLLASVILPGALAVLGIVFLVLWLSLGPDDELQARVPGLDRLGTPSIVENLVPPVAGEPIVSGGKPSDLPGEWPWFRGPNGDGICDDGVRLARKWPSGGPEVLWSVELGKGHAGPAVSGGCVYVLDYDSDPAVLADTMRCFSLDDGREIWRNSYPVEVVENHGMSRTVPAVVDDCVVSMGPKCHVACWDARTGACRWLLDLVVEYHATVPTWYTAQCPLIDRGRVILAPSGDAFMIAVDYETGEVIWESPKLYNWEMTYVSIAPMEFAGRRMYVYCGTYGVAGISAEDGAVLWETTDWVGNMATCPTPVPVGDGRIFLCGGYEAGSLMLQLKEENGRLVAETLFRLTPKQFDSEQHTPIFFDGHLFGVRTKDGGLQMACINLAGDEVWNSGTHKLGRGPYMVADGLIFAMDDHGLLRLAEATSAAYKPLDQFQALQRGRDAWGPMALVAGRLIVRDLTRMVCLDVSEK